MPATPTKNDTHPRWHVFIMHGRRADMHGRRTDRLGTVRARDEAEAIERAIEEFELQPWQRRRVLVRRET